MTHTYTYTVVFKDYEHVTFEAAAAEMLRDAEIWAVTIPEQENPSLLYGDSTGEQKGYALDHWEWSQSDHRLRAWFR